MTRPTRSTTPSKSPWSLRLERLAIKTIRARHSVIDFASLCFADPSGRPLRPAAVHRQMQAFLDQHRRALIELPRDHGKSVQAGIRILWELGRHPSLRVKIVCATASLAMERARFLRQHIDANPAMRLVFPQMKPSSPWSNDRFTIQRPSEVMGPSVTALGVGVRSTGSRADLLLCDDIVDVASLRSAAERERVKQQFRENLVNLLEPEGRLWYIFTPWHGRDLSAELKSTEAYAHFRRAVGPNLEPVWPEHWPTERLADRRAEIGESAFARAYRLQCVTDEEVAIRPAWVQTWNGNREFDRIILSVDPAASTSLRADRTALVALGRFEGRVYCISAQARRVALPDLEAWLLAEDRHRRPDAIVFESHGGFEALRSYLESRPPFRGRIVKVRQDASKANRIAAFGSRVQSGEFLLAGTATGEVDSSQIELYDELTTFPLGEHDDLVDAAAFGTAHLLDKPEILVR